jgi:hypothetical protein
MRVLRHRSRAHSQQEPCPTTRRHSRREVMRVGPSHPQRGPVCHRRSIALELCSQAAAVPVVTNVHRAEHRVWPLKRDAKRVSASRSRNGGALQVRTRVIPFMLLRQSSVTPGRAGHGCPELHLRSRRRRTGRCGAVARITPSSRARREAARATPPQTSRRSTPSAVNAHADRGSEGRRRWHATKGTLLRRRARGETVRARWFDSQRNESCTFQRASDSARRRLWGYPRTAATCSTWRESSKAVVLTNSESAPLERSLNRPRCTPRLAPVVSEARSAIVRRAGAEVAPTSFVTAQEQTDP